MIGADSSSGAPHSRLTSRGDLLPLARSAWAAWPRCRAPSPVAAGAAQAQIGACHPGRFPPIQSALTTLRRHGVETLLIGGQALILYGGPEFSRDLDLMIAASPAGLPRLALESGPVSVIALEDLATASATSVLVGEVQVGAFKASAARSRRNLYACRRRWPDQISGPQTPRATQAYRPRMVQFVPDDWLRRSRTKGGGRGGGLSPALGRREAVVA